MAWRLQTVNPTAIYRRVLSRMVLLTLLLASFAAQALAQSKSGTTIGQFLLIEPSARVAGMGNAGVSSFSEPMSAYFNPGALGHLERSGAQFTHSLWLADITYNYTLVALKVGYANTLLLTVTSLDSGDMPVRTVDQPLGTGEQFSVTDLAVGVGFGRRITDRFSGGVQVKYVREQIWNSSLTAFAIDVGVLYHLPFQAYIGASLSNFGSRGQFDGRDLRIRFDADPLEFGDNSALPAALETEDYPLPIFFRVGMGVPLSLDRNNSIKLVADAYHPSDNKESISLGAEWTFMNTISLRGGYQNLLLDDTEAGLTLGAGLQRELGGFGVHFDYAWNDYGIIGDIQRFTVSVDF